MGPSIRLCWEFASRNKRRWHFNFQLKFKQHFKWLLQIPTQTLACFFFILLQSTFSKLTFSSFFGKVLLSVKDFASRNKRQWKFYFVLEIKKNSKKIIILENDICIEMCDIISLSPNTQIMFIEPRHQVFITLYYLEIVVMFFCQ